MCYGSPFSRTGGKLPLTPMRNTASRRMHADAPGPRAAADGTADGAEGARAEEPERETGLRETRLGWLVLGVVWLAGAVYLAAYLHQGWTPFDSGMLAEQALRTLHGQVPQRDFVALYTGGLSYLNALAFRLFGVNLFSLRIPLFLFFLGWVPSVYFLARRFASPLAAGAVTLLAVAWSVPNYPEAMPSWYNLYFATWGVLALIRHGETGRRRWLWVAGMCGGLSFLMKISGVYFVAAALLYFVFRAQSTSRPDSPQERGERLGYRLFVTCGLLAFFVVLTLLIAERPRAREFFQFLLPGACLVAFLLWGTWRRGARQSGGFGCLFGEALPFLGGALAPVFVFVLWIAGRGALGDWLVGVFVRPAVRLHWSAYNAIPIVALLGLLPAALVVASAVDSNRSARGFWRWIVPVGLAVLLLAAWRWIGIYEALGYSLPLVIPVLALTAPFCLRMAPGLTERRRQQAFLLIAAAILCALIQYPFSNAIYFEYVAPLAILATGVLLALSKRLNRIAIGSLLVFYLLFAAWLHTPGYYLGLHIPPRSSYPLQTLAVARAGGIRAPAPLARKYEALIATVHDQARGSFIYATPDIPEMYFLSGFDNPTSTISDLLDPDFFNPAGRDQRILSTLRTCDINLVVLGPGDRTLAGKVQPGLRALLEARYPDTATVGNFEVRWKP